MYKQNFNYRYSQFQQKLFPLSHDSKNPHGDGDEHSVRYEAYYWNNQILFFPHMEF